MTEGKNRNTWIAQTVADLVLGAPENWLPDFSDQRIYDAPVVSIADGDDPLFGRFREVVSPAHFLPRELLEREAGGGTPITTVRVGVWALPFTEAVRASNRGGRWPSLLYSAARNNGGALNHALRQRLTRVLREGGHEAVAPVLCEDYKAFRSEEHTFSSTWSERHAAYAAGLGQFGLSGALITPVGANVRLGSVVTSAPLEPTPRPSEGYRAPCLEAGGAECGRCIERCPVGAISSQGIDTAKCAAMRKAVRERFLDAYARTLHLLPAPIPRRGDRRPGFSLGCALCQCGVPCEGRAPYAAPTQRTAHA